MTLHPRAAPPVRVRISKAVLLGALLSWAATDALARQPVNDPSQVAPGISALAWPSDREVLLRWAPKTPISWVLGVMRGYRVERAPEASPDAWTLLNQELVRPWLPDRFVGRGDETTLMIAAEILFGAPAFEPTGDPAVDDANRDSEIRRRWIFGMFSADLDSVAAEALGVRFSDRTVARGTAYRYRITLGPLPDSIDLEIDVPVAPGTVSVIASNRPAPPAPRGLLLEPGDRRITLRWDAETLDESLVAFDVDRSDDGGATYRRITANPLTFSDDPELGQAPRYWTDSTVVNYKVYHYRVHGRTVFARPTQAASAYGYARDQTAPETPFLLEGVQVEGSTVRLTWTLENDAPPDLEGFIVGHGVGEDGEIEFDESNVVLPSERSAIDGRARSHALNFYVIAARDTSGNMSVSVPRYVQLIDSIPPSPPVGLTAVADTLGRVRLAWTPGPEPDLMGYRLFKANQADHIFSLLNGDPVPDASYVDTIQVRTLTRSLYYEVAALDFNYNLSPATRVRVRLPDLVPPVAPNVTTALPTLTSVTLEWLPSDSDDVAAHIVVRSSKEDSVWTDVATLARDAAAYEDASVVPGRLYYYRVLAADSSGLRSRATVEYPVRPIDPGIRPGVEGLAAEVDPSSGAVSLTWHHAAAGMEGVFFVVFRGTPDAEPSEYRSAGTGTAFQDASAPRGQAIVYAVQTRYRDGGASLLSETVLVDIPAR